MVDVTLEVLADAAAGTTGSGPVVAVKLQSPDWELNVTAPAADLARLRDIRTADWSARRSLAAGRCAGATVFWAMGEDGAVTVLVGHDDETWDIAVGIPVAAADEIAALAAAYA